MGNINGFIGMTDQDMKSLLLAAERRLLVIRSEISRRGYRFTLPAKKWVKTIKIEL